MTPTKPTRPMLADVHCLHALAAWATKKPKRGSHYPDGTERTEHVGGKLVRVPLACKERPGHDRGPAATPHRTADGQTWT